MRRCLCDGSAEPEPTTASDGAASDWFGCSVAVSGDRIVVGARLDDDDDKGSDSGSVYVFEPDGSGGWSETKLTASDGAASDWFGYSVAVSGGWIVVGALNSAGVAERTGAAYVVDLDPVVNQPPTANDDTASTVVGTPVGIDVLANDTDPDGDVLR